MQTKKRRVSSLQTQSKDPSEPSAQNSREVYDDWLDVAEWISLQAQDIFLATKRHIVQVDKSLSYFKEDYAFYSLFTPPLDPGGIFLFTLFMRAFLSDFAGSVLYSL